MVASSSSHPACCCSWTAALETDRSLSMRGLRGSLAATGMPMGTSNAAAGGPRLDVSRSPWRLGSQASQVQGEMVTVSRCTGYAGRACEATCMYQSRVSQRSDKWDAWSDESEHAAADDANRKFEVPAGIATARSAKTPAVTSACGTASCQCRQRAAAKPQAGATSEPEQAAKSAFGVRAMKTSSSIESAISTPLCHTSCHGARRARVDFSMRW